jgi:hypothetical protein
MVARVFPNFLSIIFHGRLKAFGIPTHDVRNPLLLKEFANNYPFTSTTAVLSHFYRNVS